MIGLVFFIYLCEVIKRYTMKKMISFLSAANIRLIFGYIITNITSKFAFITDICTFEFSVEINHLYTSLYINKHECRRAFSERFPHFNARKP